MMVNVKLRARVLFNKAKALYLSNKGTDIDAIQLLENEGTALLTSDWSADSFDIEFSAFYVGAMNSEELVDRILFNGGRL